MKAVVRCALRFDRGASGDAGSTRLLAGTVTTVNGATLDGLVDLGDEHAVLAFHSFGIAFLHRFFEASEVSLDRAGKPSVFDALTLGAKDSFFL
jgi:hypothetical protein